MMKGDRIKALRRDPDFRVLVRLLKNQTSEQLVRYERDMLNKDTEGATDDQRQDQTLQEGS
jgi:hypothetical protein